VGGKTTFARSLNALAIDGHVAVVGFLSGMEVEVKATGLIRKMARVRGISVGHRRAFEDMNRAIEANGLRPVVGRQFSFSEVPAAFAHLSEGAFGKIVIRGLE
jgi:alcohol dehydrogenase